VADCVICRIVDADIPAKIVHQDERALAFHDIDPAAPFHVLVVPRDHVPKLSELGDEAPGGFAGQSVWHLHLHVLGGRQFTWPPG